MKEKKKKKQRFFVIIHGSLLNWRRDRKQLTEIKRIKQNEDFAKVEGQPQKIPSRVPKNKKIFVCGAYGNVCVAIQAGALKRAGYDVEIYKKATAYLLE